MIGEIRICPECGQGIRVINGKIARHERGLAYVPYKLYQKICKITGTSVKEQARKNLCKGSGGSLSQNLKQGEEDKEEK